MIPHACIVAYIIYEHMLLTFQLMYAYCTFCVVTSWEVVCKTTSIPFRAPNPFALARVDGMSLGWT